MNKTIEGRVRLYLVGLMIIIVLASAASGFFYVEEVRTEGYYFEVKAANDNFYVNLRNSK